MFTRLLQDEMEEEAAIMGHVSRSKQMLAGMFDQGTAILAGMSGNRQRIKVSILAMRPVDSAWECTEGASQYPAGHK
jgi:hypothetical protein